MLCEHCQQRNAHLQITQSINGKTITMHLCEICANEFKTKGTPFSFSLQDFLKGFQEEDSDKIRIPGTISRRRCSRCDQTYEDYQRTGLFGCADCYHHFRPVIMPMVRRIQGNQQHRGKMPDDRKRVHRMERKQHQLQQILHEAIRSESYEKAAAIRDQLQLLETKIRHLKEGS